MRLFGTDGIRGLVMASPMTPEDMFTLGAACGRIIKKGFIGRGNNTVVIGCDTRYSCCMLQLALMAGLLWENIGVECLGCLPTPAVALNMLREGSVCGLMISSSHNASDTNGIKFFNSSGRKFSQLQERALEDEIDLGRKEVLNDASIMTSYKAEALYIDCLRKLAGDLNLSGMKIVVDCANGAASHVAEQLFSALGATIYVINNRPNGHNINAQCGVLHLEGNICAKVVELGADLGIAFDGDGDRVLFCDERGRVVDGDMLIAYLAVNMKRHGLLRNNCVICTSISNIALEKYLNSLHINVKRTDVGERLVVDAMIENNLSLGGEKSGHLIISYHCYTSDGLAAAVQVLRFLTLSELRVSDQFSLFDLCPQVFSAVPKRGIKDFSGVIFNSQAMKNCVQDMRSYLGDEGRLLLRESGTEDIVRIMAECADIDKAKYVVQVISNTMNALIDGNLIAGK